MNRFDGGDENVSESGFLLVGFCRDISGGNFYALGKISQCFKNRSQFKGLDS